MWFRRRQALDDLDQDIRAHIDQATDDLIGRGVPPGEARRQARVRFGNAALAAEDSRAVWGRQWLEELTRNLRFALRLTRRTPLFAVVAVLSLAIGIGANTAVFSFLESVFLRPLPVEDPGSLVILKWRAQGYALASSGMSWSTDASRLDTDSGTLSSIFPYPALEVFEESDDVLSSAFCFFVEDRLGVAIGGQTESVVGHYVSGAYFSGIGLTPLAGRLIQPADDDRAAAAVAVLSARVSQRHFGTAENAVGQTIRINDTPFVVVGVAPDEFFGAEPGAIPDVYLPFHAQSTLLPWMETEQRYQDAHFYWIEIMGRLRADVTLAEAQTALGARFRQFVESTASTERQRADLPQLVVTDGSVGLDSLRQRYGAPIYALMAMVGLLLLIACSNAAHLSLAHVIARRRELALRLGIGAGRGRIIRQLLTESLLLSSVGGVLGVGLAWWGMRVLTLLFAGGRTNFTLHAELNWVVLGASVGLSCLTGILFGLAPAIRATRVDVAPALRAASSGGRRRRLWRPTFGHALVVTQVALSLLLLVAAGLFGRSLANLHAIELGFDPENVLVFTLRPSTVGYEGTSLGRFYEDLRLRVNALPHVQGVTLSSRALPMGSGTMAVIEVAGAAAASNLTLEEESQRYAALVSVGPDFFGTMRIPLLTGREFSTTDRLGAPAAAIVNRRLADVHGIDDPVGRTITLDGNALEIVGLVEDSLVFALKEEPTAAMYLPYLRNERPAGQMTYAVRTSGDPLALAAAIRDVVRQLDDRVALHNVTTLSTHVDQAISTEIALARLSAILAVVTLVVACVGFYGTVAFSVARRTNEIGVRIALGAQRTRIVWAVLGDILVLVVVGLIVGVPLVLGGSRYVDSLLYGLEPRDPVAIGVAVGLLATCGVVAALAPALRASRIDPLTAIRTE